MVTYSKIFPGCRVGISEFGNGSNQSPRHQTNSDPFTWALDGCQVSHKDCLGIFGKIPGWRVDPVPVSLPPPYQANAPAQCPESVKDDSDKVCFLFISLINLHPCISTHLPNSSYLLEGWDILRSPFLSPLPLPFDKYSCLALTHSPWRLLTWFFLFFQSMSVKWSGKITSLLLSSDPFLALDFVRHWHRGKGVWHRPNLKPRGLQGQGTTSFPLWSIFCGTVLAYWTHKIIQVL